MSRSTTRRRFLQTTAVAAAGYWVAGGVQAKQSKSPNEQVHFACIGVEGKGLSDSNDAKAHGTVVAICDIDETNLDGAALRFPGARKFFDYRTMLTEMGNKFDAVTVSIPDHQHGVATAMAMRLGKHCFTQKPLTHSISEARTLGQIARETKVVTQMGNQGTAESGLRRAAAQIRSGMLGAVKEVHVWTNRPIWPQGVPRPAASAPPATVHWPEFIGPAADRPYAKGYHPINWRGWWDFGCGALGDMACHTVNLAYMALDLKKPVVVEAETSGHNKDSYPSWSRIRYDFAATQHRPAVSLFWYDGGKLPKPTLVSNPAALKDKSGKMAGSGCIILGEKGFLFSPDDYGTVSKVFGGAKEIKVEFPISPGHFTEWVDAIKGTNRPMSNFPDYAGPLTETVLVGNLAVWLGGKVEWDADNMKATNAPELDVLIRPKFQHGYTI